MATKDTTDSNNKKENIDTKKQKPNEENKFHDVFRSYEEYEEECCYYCGDDCSDDNMTYDNNPICYCCNNEKANIEDGIDKDCC